MYCLCFHAFCELVSVLTLNSLTSVASVFLVVVSNLFVCSVCLYESQYNISNCFPCLVLSAACGMQTRTIILHFPITISTVSANKRSKHYICFSARITRWTLYTHAFPILHGIPTNETLYNGTKVIAARICHNVIRSSFKITAQSRIWHKHVLAYEATSTNIITIPT